MPVIEIIPKREEIGKSLELASRYHAAFEYNDFFVPDVLDDPRQVDALISFYLKLPRDRSLDTLHGTFLDITVHSSDSLIRKASDQRIRQSMEIAKALGVRGVVFHTNLIANFQDAAYRQGWLEQNHRYFTALAAEYPGLHIYMENMFDLTPDMYAAFGSLTRDCPNLHLCLDIAHANLSQTPIEEWIQRTAGDVRHLHLNDNDGVSDLHLAVGQGSIDWHSVDRWLRRCQVDASVLVETSFIDRQEQSLSYLEQNHIYPFS